MTWIDVVDRYAKTFFDFWLLRPRGFIAAKNRSPSNYLSPYQFLYACLSIVFVVYVVAVSLVATVSLVGTVSLEPTAASIASTTLAGAISGLLLLVLITGLLWGALVFRTLTRVWPIRGSATFVSIFKFRCYMMAIWLPQIVLILFLSLLPVVLVMLKQLSEQGPIWNSISVEEISIWTSIAVLVIGVISSVLTLFFWELPGIAAVNGVSTLRVWAGLLFWPAAFVFAVVGVSFVL